MRAVFPGARLQPEPPAEPTEAAPHPVDRCPPGRSIALGGHATEPDGHRRRSLRRSGGRDDVVAGHGPAPTVPLAALLSVACRRTHARTA